MSIAYFPCVCGYFLELVHAIREVLYGSTYFQKNPSATSEF